MYGKGLPITTIQGSLFLIVTLSTGKTELKFLDLFRVPDGVRAMLCIQGVYPNIISVCMHINTLYGLHM